MATSESLDTESFRGRDYVLLDSPVSGFSEQLKCPICLQLPTEPVSTSCGHAYLFCRDCIKDLTSCPLCRRRRGRGFSISPEAKIEQAMNKLRVKCKGCSWQGQLGDAQEHVCDSLNECEQPLKQRRPHEPFTCEHCGGFFNEAGSHLAIRCKNFPRPCPEKCGHIVTEKSIDHHLTTECPEVHIACKYAMFGCNAAVRRREMSYHLASSYHSKLITSEALSTVGKFYLSPSDTMLDLGSIPLSFRPWLQNKICPFRYFYLPRIVKLRFEWDDGFGVRMPTEHRYSIFGGLRFNLSCDKASDLHFCRITLLFAATDSDGLNFPFNANIKLSLLNQERDSNHMHWTNWNLLGTDAFNRGKSKKYLQETKTIPLKDLDYNSETDTAYRKNSTMFLRIDSFEPV